ncbi:MAG: dienelactone hydrolase family protein [Anaerolineae bacterium]|nr:dienelactone hydrolase family protein [Anaerolineae bacterium]
MTAPLIHEEQPIIAQGSALETARVAMILVHGRGGDARGILPLTNHFDAEGVAYLAPSAAGNSWYPYRFLEPRERNEPYLSSALQKIGAVLDEVQAAGIPPEKTMLLGFSQGACLALEFAARNPQHYGGIVALSGGLIGAEDELVGYVGSLKGTPVFLGCSDVDFHIPLDRVHETAEIFQSLGAKVDERIYPGMGHTINDDEVQAVREMLTTLL